MNIKRFFQRTIEPKHVIRQGDVLLVEVTDDSERSVANAKGRTIDGLVLAYGEVTGHAHRLSAPVELLTAHDDAELKDFANRGGASLRIVSRNDDVILRHEEHAPLILKKGKVYEIRRQREYDATTEAKERPVFD